MLRNNLFSILHIILYFLIKSIKVQLMIKKLNDILAGIPATLVGGIFLLMSFIFPRVNIILPADPAWVTVFICGLPLLYLAVKRIIYNPGISKISSALLITIAMIAAIIIGDLFAAGEVAFIMAIGAILEEMTTDRAKKGLKKLIALAPSQGRRISNGSEEMIPAEKIRENDILRILPGETIPVDGKIISGETSVNQSVMTGESLPVDKAVGDDVFCGTINRFGAIDIKATKVGEDSSLQKLIRMVREAEDKKAPMARIADKCASWLVPAAFMIAVITGILTDNLERAVTVLVVFCPCALVLATPTAIMAAIGQATKHGVIIKSGESLEKMGKVDTVAFDKTGTLTYGKLKISDIVSFNDDFSAEDILYLTASAESKSEHPLGKAVYSSALSSGIKTAETEDFRMMSGKGVSAKIAGKTYYCGNEKYLCQYGILLNEKAGEKAEELRKQGKAMIFTASETECLGLIALSDEIRPQVGKMVSDLAALHTDTVLLTGDSKNAAGYFADLSGIKNVYAELLPEEKVMQISKLLQQHKTVCMIGDGVNDAPALKTASVGVAMGSFGSDIAVEAADIALMSDDLSKIPYLKKLSDATVKTIKFSIALSMCINFIAVTLSVAGILTPTSGALVHNAGSCFVVLIAALLYDRKFK